MRGGNLEFVIVSFPAFLLGLKGMRAFFESSLKLLIVQNVEKKKGGLQRFLRVIDF